MDWIDTQGTFLNYLSIEYFDWFCCGDHKK